MQRSSSGPGRSGYVIAAIVFVLGIIGAAALVAVFVFGLLGLGDDLERVVVPGADEVELTETGGYTIYYEYRSHVEGIDYDTEQRTPNLSINVTRVEDGKDVQVNPSLMSTSYTLTNHAGRSIRTFDVEEPGRYQISAEYTDGSDSPPFVLAVGQGVARGILTSIGSFFAAGAVFCVLTTVAIAIAGVTLYRRYRAEQASAAQP